MFVQNMLSNEENIGHDFEMYEYFMIYIATTLKSFNNLIEIKSLAGLLKLYKMNNVIL